MTEKLYTVTIVTPYSNAHSVTVRVVDETPARGIYPARAVVEAVDGYPFPLYGRGECIEGSGDIHWYNQREVNAADLVEVVTPEPLLVEVMQARFDALEKALDEPMSQERANEIMNELVDLQAAIEKENGAMDDYAFGRTLLKDGPL